MLGERDCGVWIVRARVLALTMRVCDDIEVMTHVKVIHRVKNRQRICRLKQLLSLIRDN